MNEFSITPFRGPHLLLLLLTATAVLLIFLLLRGKPEARRSRYLIGVCFFNLALFSGFSLLMPRIFGYYVTYALLVVCGLSLATLGFYRPAPRDIPQILKTFGLLAVGAHLINLMLRLTLCPEANYFFTYGAEIGVLKLFWRIIPVPLLYGLPAPLILAAYMYAVCALSRLTQGEEEVSFS